MQASGPPEVFITTTTVEDACHQECSGQQELSKQRGHVELLQAQVSEPGTDRGQEVAGLFPGSCLTKTPSLRGPTAVSLSLF